MMGLGACVLPGCTSFFHSSTRGLTTTVHLYIGLSLLGTLFMRRLGNGWLHPSLLARIAIVVNISWSSMLIALFVVPCSCLYMALVTSLIISTSLSLLMHSTLTSLTATLITTCINLYQILVNLVFVLQYLINIEICLLQLTAG